MDLHVKLNTLPVEILSKILELLDIFDLVSTSQVCRSLNACSLQDILWKNLCSKDYTFWNPSTPQVSWRERYISRFTKDRVVDTLVDSCIQNPILPETVQHFERLNNEIGVEAKDCLFHHRNTRSDAPDVLARRWWATELMWFLNRVEASKRLFEVLTSNDDWHEEEVLTCFDMLLRRDGIAYHAFVYEIIDDMTKQFKEEHPKFTVFTTRQLALKLADYLVVSVGINYPKDENSFFQPSNSLISYVLSDHEHRGLPITHCTIYCAIARRLGLRSRILGLPGDVFVVVYPPDGKNADHKRLPDNAQPDRLYLDIIRDSNWEVSEDYLIRRTQELTIAPEDERQRWLEPLTPRTFSYRIGNNLVRCINHFETLIYPMPEHGLYPLTLLYGLSLVSLIDRASGNFMRMNPMRQDDHEFDHPGVHYRNVGGYAQELRPWDNLLIQELRTRNPFHHQHLHIHPMPTPPVEVKRRSPPNHEVRYILGQVFNHARYNYRGVIVGWDSTCALPPEWQTLQGVGNLRRGGAQPFYNVAADDGSFRYVAEDNIRVTSDPPDSRSYLDQLVGRFFLRWDPTTKRFISNLKFQYPND
jgi:F-box protein 21